MKNPIEIKDLNAPELDAYARISEVQLLPGNKRDICVH